MPVVVLLAAIAMECFSFRTAIVESNHVRGDQSWVQFVRHAKAPELPVVLLEDLGALIGLVLALFGVGLTLITDDGTWDGLGTICIGVLLVVIAVRPRARDQEPAARARARRRTPCAGSRPRCSPTTASSGSST